MSIPKSAKEADFGIDIKLGDKSNNSDVFYFNQNDQILGGFDFMNFQFFLNVGSLTIKVHFLKHFKISPKCSHSFCLNLIKTNKKYP